MENNICTLIFTGDIGFDRYIDGKWNDESLLSEKILKFFDKSDYVVVNVAGALLWHTAEKKRKRYLQSDLINGGAIWIYKNIWKNLNILLI